LNKSINQSINHPNHPLASFQHSAETISLIAMTRNLYERWQGQISSDRWQNSKVDCSFRQSWHSVNRERSMDFATSSQS